jgi:DNA-binding HxlR family transcriptional regulator
MRMRAVVAWIVGERWTMLIIREALLGVHRFDEMQADLRVVS